MSERSGLGTKGEKNQGKFKGIDINNIYKGTSVTQPKSAPGESILDVVCGTFELSLKIMDTLALLNLCFFKRAVKLVWLIYSMVECLLNVLKI